MRPSGRTLASRTMSVARPGAGPKLSNSLSLGTIRYSGTVLQSSEVVALPERAATLSGPACASAVAGRIAKNAPTHRPRNDFMNAPIQHPVPDPGHGKNPGRTHGSGYLIDSADAGGGNRGYR